LQAGYQVVVLDKLYNSSPGSLRRVQALAGKPLNFIEGDVRNPQVLRDFFSRHKISAVARFARLKAVGEGTERPLDYFSVNVAGIITLVFRSSCTVCGDPQYAPIPGGPLRG
jgi:UDP-glucose 4-epimerase